MKVNLIIITLVILVNITLGYGNDVTSESDRNSQLFRKYVHMDKQLRQYIDKGVKKMLPSMLEASGRLNISSTCMDNLFHFLSGIRKLSNWTISFLDAMGKPQSGLMAGNLPMYGEFNQCFNTVVKRKDKFHFRGQYCSIIVKPILPVVNDIYYGYQFEEFKDLAKDSSDLMKLMASQLSGLYFYDPKVGVCVPSGCAEEDISQILNYLSEQLYINATVNYCVKKEDMCYWTNPRIIVVCVIGFFGILLLLSTILDNTLDKWKKNDLGIAARLLQCFSVTRNFPKLINTVTSKDSITCLYGMRVLSTFWVILCHEYVVETNEAMSNHGLNGVAFIQSFFGQIVMNGFTAIETFFFLGGFVNCYSRVKLQTSGKAQPSMLQLLTHRAWRMYPTLIVTNLAFIFLSSYLPPFYKIQNTMQEACSKHWWKNFFFINNLFHPSEMCLPQTWYVSADMQLFLLSLITVPALLRNGKMGMYLHIGIIFIASACCFMLWWNLELAPIPSVFSAANPEDMSMSKMIQNVRIYMLPFIHIASYYIGVVLGYVVASKKVKKFSKVSFVIGWFAASFLFTFTLFFTYRWNSGTHYTKLESSLYASASKFVLVSCIAWMVYCCATEQARLINYILSLGLWIPLSRLTYMAYMLSIMVQAYFNANLNFPPDLASMFTIWSYIGNLCVTHLISLVLVLLIESPLLNMEKVLCRRKPDENKSSSDLQKANALKIQNRKNVQENQKTETK